MDVKQLKALVTVVETGSVTRAAECSGWCSLLSHGRSGRWRTSSAYRCSTGPVRACARRRREQPCGPGRRALAELDRARAELAVTPGTVTGIVSIGLLESTAELLAGHWYLRSCRITRGSNSGC